MGCGKSRAVESEENQKQVFLPSHRPWKSSTTRWISTFPTAPTTAGISQTTSGNLIVVDRKECLTPDSPATLADWRSQGKGPAYFKTGRKIWYPKDRVDAWLESQMRDGGTRHGTANQGREGALQLQVRQQAGCE